MKIVIAGAGEVGTHLAKMLSQENHDIILIDANEERLHFNNSMEVLPIVGNPTSLKDLTEADISKADLFISVTPEENTNITACILASKLGAHKTFARINNYEYLLPKNKEMLFQMGIGSMIYPEMLAAKEIVTTIRRPWAHQYWELFDSSIILIAVKVNTQAERLVGVQLQELSHAEKFYHIVAILRKNETLIPGGNDRIEMGDILYFTTTKDHVNDVRVLTGIKNTEIKKITIMGGSRIATLVCQYLPNNIHIKLIEKDKEKCHRIAEIVPNNVMVINGDGHDTDLFLQERMQDTDTFIALTENSSTNILSCLAAKRMGVEKTIAKVENLDYISLAENLDISLVINKKLIAASHIYQFTLDADVSNVKCLTFCDADVAELVARPNSRITKKQVKDLKLPNTMTLGGLIRNDDPLIIKGETQIQPYDHVVVFCLGTAMRKLEDYFN